MKNFMSFSSYIKTDSASAESLERLNTQTVNLKKTCVESESDELNFVLSQIDQQDDDEVNKFEYNYEAMINSIEKIYFKKVNN